MFFFFNNDMATTIKGNVGEWSEVYVLFRLLAQGKMNVADDNLNAIPEEFYKILAIIREETATTNNYVREDDMVSVEVTNKRTGDVERFSMPIIKFADEANLLLNEIQTKIKIHTSAVRFLSELKITSVQRGAGAKRDITIKIEDFHCGMAQTLGFSIKSFLGADSSLFNAGPGTNFVFKVKLPSDMTIDVDAFNRETYGNNKRLSSRIIKLINDYKAEITFDSVQSNCFYQNLRTIDGDMPYLLSQLLLIRFYNQVTDVNSCVKILTENNPLGFDIENHGEVYEYKIKRFLQDCSLGMVPERPWTGRYDATGGQIIVKEDGDVLCYHIYELNRFLDYLFNNTKFETASTSEDENNPGYPHTNPKKKYFFGWLFEDNGMLYIKLNLQIRFK